LEEFDSKPTDHWTINEANLQKINTAMEDYLETILRLNIEKNYINISAIVRNNDKINLIRLVILTIRNSVNEYWE